MDRLRRKTIEALAWMAGQGAAIWSAARIEGVR